LPLRRANEKDFGGQTEGWPMKRRQLWAIFTIVQLAGAIGATVGIMWSFFLSIVGSICLLPGLLVAYAFLRKWSANSIWVPLAGLAIAIPVNALFWYVYSRKACCDEDRED